ncbi:MAG: TPM domain-containing protein [Acidobacteria bacterium]|nr:TPM domain-containing protein [Acidobacteriota bacterium]
MDISDYLSAEEVMRVEAKLRAVEQLTSAEIKVALTRSSWMGIGNKAAKLFRRYGLDVTEKRNGVLILVDVKNHELLIYGDRGINENVAENFWNAIRDAMICELREGRLAAALLTGIHQIGDALSTLFPAEAGDIDEISNELLLVR